MSIDPRIPLGVQPLQIQNPLEAMTQLAELEGRREQAEARRLAAEEKRQQVAQAQALEQALQASIIIDPKTKRITFDRKALLANAPASVAYKLQQQIDEDEVSANKLAESLLDLEGKKRDYRGSISRTIRASGYNPDVFQRLMHSAQGFGALDDETAAQYATLGDTGQIQAIVDDYIGQTTEAPTPAAVGSREDYLARHAQQLGKPVVALTPAEIATGIAEFEAAERAPEKGPTAGSFEDYLTRRFGKTPTPEQIITARRAYEPPMPPALQLVPIVGPDGRPVLVPESQAVGQTPGSAAVGARPATEGERKAAGFHGQMQQALTTINQLESQLTERDLYQIQSLPQEGITGAMNRGLMSDAAKRYIQAFNQFTEARLRPVSGAAIAASEYERDRATYGKQYAETPELAAQRQAARAQALEALRTMGGAAIEEPPPAGRSRATKQKIGRFEIEVEVQ